MSNEDDSKSNEVDYKYQYEKAIEGRAIFQESFNHWMNMYAIFNGALFVALYSILQNADFDKIFNVDGNFVFMILATVILGLGTLCGWSWHKSVKGYYSWIISWINVVSYYESKLENSDGKEALVYRLYGGGTKGNAYSTQKLTFRFTFFVAVSWTAILLWGILMYLCKMIQLKCVLSCPLLLFLIVFVLVGVVGYILANLKDESLYKKGIFNTRENLKNGHTHACLRDISDGNLSSYALKKFKITDFD